MPILRDVGRDLDREVGIDRPPLIGLRRNGVLRAVVVVLHLLVVLLLAAGKHGLVAVQGRELRRGEQADRSVLLQGLQAQVEVRRHASQVDRAADTPQQIIHRARPEGHIHTGGKRARCLHAFVSHTRTDAYLMDLALGDIGDQYLHRYQRYGPVDRAQEGLHARHVASVAREDQGVQVGKGLHGDMAFQRFGDDLFDIRHGAVDERQHACRCKRVCGCRAEDPDAALHVVAVRRAFEQH